MKVKSVFYLCKLCKKTVDVTIPGAGTLVCCGEDMKELVANSEDANVDAHTPKIEKVGNDIHVTLAHPMTEEHLIEWIALVCEDCTHRINLSHTDEAKAIFKDVSEGEVYAYCNLHGLWKNKI